MPGVGKTTLIKAIAKQAQEECLFQEVVVVTVSQNPNLLKLQDDIAEKLDLKDLGVDLFKRAQKLSERLNQDAKTTLIILDDVWERIELVEVGIPYKNNGKCCKVVFTTRFGTVCDRMEADIKTEVAVLPKEDSWILFQQKAGNVPDSSLAYDVLKECKGLPLAIVTLGLALRNRNTFVWKDTLQQLRKSIFFEGMSPVISSIKLSYNFMRSESLKICFLFCCLFPEDHKIKLDVLLSYVMGEKLLKDVDTYDEARDRLYNIVDELVSSGLLLRGSSVLGDGVENIMMHDVVRDVAISIAAEEEGQIVKAGRNLSYRPEMDLENCKRLSMMHNPIKLFPTTPIEAPHLQSLFLNNNHQLTELPSDLFTAMISLKTLDLSDTDIESFPPSLSCLQNLHTILLNNTKLNNLSPVEKLVQLEVLGVNGSNFWNEDVLEQIGNLSNLRILDLTKASLSNSIRSDLFSKLRKLEKFHMLESVSESFHTPERRKIESEFFSEIGSLSRLTSLELQIRNPELCHVDIPGPWQNLTTFRIVFDTEFEDKALKRADYSRSLWLGTIRLKEVLADWVLVLLRRTNHLGVSRCTDLQSLTEFGAAAKGMNENLKSLHLAECHSMECLVSSSNAFLNNLEELKIRRMDAFVEICRGTPPPRLLHKLKKLKFFSCGSLVIAIPRKLIQNLQNLESLTVGSCENLVHVVEEEETLVSLNSNMSNISEPLVLPLFRYLKSFSIKDVPKIRYIFTMRVARNLLQLKRLEIKSCPGMEVLFKYEDGEDIQCDQQFKDAAILPYLGKLILDDLPNFKSVTNRNLVMEFPSLYSVNVTELEMLDAHTYMHFLKFKIRTRAQVIRAAMLFAEVGASAQV